MANSEKVIGFRFDEDILKKLDWLLREDEKECERMGVKPQTRKEIIEEAIKELYFKRINSKQDADVVERIAEMVHDEVGVSMNNLHRKIDEILFLTIKNDYGNKLLYRSPSVLPVPENTAEVNYTIENEKSKWDLALEEFMNREWKKRIKEYEEKEGSEDADTVHQ